MTATRYSFLGFDCPERVAVRFVDGLTVFDERYGSHVVRRRTEQLKGVPHKPKADTDA